MNLNAQMLNNGSVATGTSFTVTFYADQALTQVIGSTVVSDPVGGCVGRPLTARTTWANLPVGAYPFWVKIDSAGNIAETNEGDNVGTGTVTVSDIWEVSTSRIALVTEVSCPDRMAIIVGRLMGGTRNT